MIDKHLALQPMVNEPVKPYRYWMKFVRSHFIRPAYSLQPRGIALPDRVWQRQSALIMSLRETRPVR
jgi:hypothetical protein